MRVGVLVVVAVALFAVYSAVTGDANKADVTVIKDSQGVEKHLRQHKGAFSEADYERYRGHIYRVLSAALKFLEGNPKAQQFRQVIEAALVYHDIALWTTGDLSYVGPSDEQARKMVKGLNKEEAELMSNIILYHHKITPFRGENADIVNAVIKGDLCDFSLGLVRSGFSKHNVAKLRQEIPDTGFHWTLAKRIPAIRGWNFLFGTYEVMHIFKW